MIASRLATNRAIIHFNNIAIVPLYYTLMSSYVNGLVSGFYFRFQCYRHIQIVFFLDLQPKKHSYKYTFLLIFLFWLEDFFRHHKQW